MHAFAINALGDVGSLRELPTPVPGPGEILVRVCAAGVSSIDLKIRDGTKHVDNVQFPFVLGQECAGVVAQVGSGVQFHPGGEVFGAFWTAGTFAEYVLVPVVRVGVAPKPAGLDFIQAAALPIPMLGAQSAMWALGPGAGQTVLLIGATGCVGSYILQLAVQGCKRIIATARPGAEEQVRKLGATEVIDYTSTDMVSAVRAMHSDGVDALIDLVSDRPTFTHHAGAVRRGGKLVSTIHSADVELLEKRGFTAVNINTLGSYTGMDQVARTMIDTPLFIPIVRTYPLAEAGEALAQLQTGHARGKIVLTVP